MPYPPHNTPASNGKAKSDCLAWETMLTDALDGTLSPAEQRLFDLHQTVCTRCAGELAEAQRGAAWLEMLKSPRPQPRPELLASILAQTSGLSLEPELTSAYGVPARFIPSPARAGAWQRWMQVMLEPRLAMTAAMAFCSIALTLSLTGVRLNDLHASDLGPSGVRRTLHVAQAGAVRYYDNLRVVHVLESRADDLRENLQSDRDQPSRPEPRPQAEPAPEQKKPEPSVPPAGGSSRMTPNPPATSLDAPRFASVLALLTPWSSNGDLS